MPTIKEVAHQAKVSLGTVSRVINGNESVGPELRRHVQTVIDQLGYRPNGLARSLRNQRSQTLGLVIPDVTNPFFAELVKGVERYAASEGYGIILGNSEESPEVEARYIKILSERRVDGLLVVPCVATRNINIHAETKMVLIDRPVGDHIVVSSDHQAGAVSAVTHLIELGHRKIACIAGPPELTVAAERHAGYRETMASHFPGWHKVSRALTETGTFDYSAGYKAARRLLSKKSRPTALFAGSDQQAIGALRAAADLSIKVPAELSIVGFDNIPLSDLVTPRLTTVSQAVAEVSRLAVETLLRLRRGQASGSPPRLLTTLVVRDSCGRCAGK